MKSLLTYICNPMRFSSSGSCESAINLSAPKRWDVWSLKFFLMYMYACKQLTPIPIMTKDVSYLTRSDRHPFLYCTTCPVRTFYYWTENAQYQYDGGEFRRLIQSICTYILFPKISDCSGRLLGRKVLTWIPKFPPKAESFPLQP